MTRFSDASDAKTWKQWKKTSNSGFSYWHSCCQTYTIKFRVCVKLLIIVVTICNVCAALIIKIVCKIKTADHVGPVHQPYNPTLMTSPILDLKKGKVGGQFFDFPLLSPIQGQSKLSSTQQWWLWNFLSQGTRRAFQSTSSTKRSARHTPGVVQILNWLGWAKRSAPRLKVGTTSIWSLICDVLLIVCSGLVILLVISVARETTIWIYFNQGCIFRNRCNGKMQTWQSLDLRYWGTSMKEVENA